MQTSETPVTSADPDVVVLRGAPLPTERRRPQPPASPPSQNFAWRQPHRRRRFGGLLGISAAIMIGLPTLMGMLYFGPLDTDQYVTEFKFTVRSAQAPPAPQKDTMSAKNNPHFEFVALVNKYLNTSNLHCVGWTVLRRKG